MQQLRFKGDIKSLKSRHCYMQCEDNNDNSVLFYYSKKEFPRKTPLETKTLLEMSSIQKLNPVDAKQGALQKITASCRAGFNLSGKIFETLFSTKKTRTCIDKGSPLQTLHSLLPFVLQKRKFLSSVDEGKVAQSWWNRKKLPLVSINYQCISASVWCPSSKQHEGWQLVFG